MQYLVISTLPAVGDPACRPTYYLRFVFFFKHTFMVILRMVYGIGFTRLWMFHDDDDDDEDDDDEEDDDDDADDDDDDDDDDPAT